MFGYCSKFELLHWASRFYLFFNQNHLSQFFSEMNRVKYQTKSFESQFVLVLVKGEYVF